MTMAMPMTITVVAGSRQGRLNMATRQADDEERAIDVGSSRHVARPLYTMGARSSGLYEADDRYRCTVQRGKIASHDNCKR